MKNLFVIFLMAFIHALNAQSQINDSLIYNANKIEMENLRNQSYLKDADKINCDSTSSSIAEDRICANLELLKQDSLLQFELGTLISTLISNMQDSVSLRELLLSQELWERYRYAHCSHCVLDGNRLDMILFMRCATELTIKRREDIKKLCDY